MTKRKWPKNLSTLGLVCHGARKKCSNHLLIMLDASVQRYGEISFVKSISVSIIATFFTVKMIETFSWNEKRILLVITNKKWRVKWSDKQTGSYSWSVILITLGIKIEDTWQLSLRYGLTGLSVLLNGLRIIHFPCQPNWYKPLKVKSRYKWKLAWFSLRKHLHFCNSGKLIGRN